MMNKAILSTTLAISILLPFAPTYANAAPTATLKHIITDSEITSQINSLYSKSPLLRNQHIVVTTHKRRVTLQGQTKTNHQYERAIIIAESVEGVRHVNVDNLAVKFSRAPLSDSFITAKVKSNFMKEKMFGTQNIRVWPVKVETKDAVVYLTGTVHSKREKNMLIHLANQVKGVKSVVSSLTVK
ncbi:MAG: BON domain-containing protein [Legionella sp.]|nr:BON domain-containing protein [Legionella sp.]